MIAFTYGVSGVLLALSGYLFSIGALSAQTQTIAWMVIFFFASPAASAAYLTVSETFPLEVRALAIALFYAIGTGIGGVAGPALFGALIDTGSRNSVFAGYLLGSALMIAAAVVAWRYAIAAERKSLEIGRAAAGRCGVEYDEIRNWPKWHRRRRSSPTMKCAGRRSGAALRWCRISSESAILLDIDGTLLDLAPTPREVWVPPGLAKTLKRLLGAHLGRAGAGQRPFAQRHRSDLRARCSFPRSAATARKCGCRSTAKPSLRMRRRWTRN